MLGNGLQDLLCRPGNDLQYRSLCLRVYFVDQDFNTAFRRTKLSLMCPTVISLDNNCSLCHVSTFYYILVCICETVISQILASFLCELSDTCVPQSLRTALTWNKKNGKLAFCSGGHLQDNMFSFFRDSSASHSTSYLLIPCLVSMSAYLWHIF